MKYWTRCLCYALVVSVGIGAALMVDGCGKKPKPAMEVVKTEPPPPPPPAVEPEKPAEEPRVEVVLDDIFFDYDKSNLRNDALKAMERNAGTLSSNPAVKILLEGHCDERGTVEYNLALGDRRAQSAKNYLQQFGIDASRLSTISYGEEKPFAQGQDESAWSKNRRVHFVIQ